MTNGWSVPPAATQMPTLIPWEVCDSSCVGISRWPLSQLNSRRVTRGIREKLRNGQAKNITNDCKEQKDWWEVNVCPPGLTMPGCNKLSIGGEARGQILKGTTGKAARRRQLKWALQKAGKLSLEKAWMPPKRNPIKIYQTDPGQEVGFNSSNELHWIIDSGRTFMSADERLTERMQEENCTGSLGLLCGKELVEREGEIMKTRECSQSDPDISKSKINPVRRIFSTANRCGAIGNGNTSKY